MLLTYRGISYRAHASSLQHCSLGGSAIALTYRGTSYAIERSQNTHGSHLHQAEMFLAYRGVLYCRT